MWGDRSVPCVFFCARPEFFGRTISPEIRVDVL